MTAPDPDAPPLGHPSDGEPPLPGDLAAALLARGLPADGEVALRRVLEAHLPGYSLYRLLPAAAKRWKIRYRLMAGDAWYDGQTAAEAYARAARGGGTGGKPWRVIARPTGEAETFCSPGRVLCCSLGGETQTPVREKGGARWDMPSGR